MELDFAKLLQTVATNVKDFKVFTRAHVVKDMMSMKLFLKAERNEKQREGP